MKLQIVDNYMQQAKFIAGTTETTVVNPTTTTETPGMFLFWLVTKKMLFKHLNLH